MGQTSPRDEEFNPKMDTDVLWYFFFSPQRTDSRNIREELPPESSDVGDVWCWSSSMQGSSLSTLHPRLDISSGGEACSESVLHISRTCLGTQRFWPSRRSVSWFFRETRESTSWNGEFKKINNKKGKCATVSWSRCWNQTRLSVFGLVFLLDLMHVL